MKKLILGMAAVFCLQIGFVAFNANYRARDVALKNLADDAASDPLISLFRPADDPIADFWATGVGEDTLVPALTQDRRNNRPMIAVRDGARQRTLAARRADFVASQKRLLKEIRDRQRPTGRESDDLAVSDNKKPRVESKSFIAKAAPIVTKPYDWLKAVASKLK